MREREEVREGGKDRGREKERECWKGGRWGVEEKKFDLYCFLSFTMKILPINLIF